MYHQAENRDHLTRAQLALLTAQQSQNELQPTSSETEETMSSSNDYLNDEAYEELMDIPNLDFIADVKIRDKDFSYCCPDLFTSFTLVYDMCLGRKVEERSLIPTNNTPVTEELGSDKPEDLLRQWITKWCGQCPNYVFLYHATGHFRVQIIHSYPTISDAMKRIEEIIKEQVREMLRFFDCSFVKSLDSPSAK